MPIQYVQRPFTVKATNGSSATLSEETGVTADNHLIVVKSATDDGAGNIGAGNGTVAYASRAVSLKVVSQDRTTTAYKSDHERADEFERVVADGEGSSGSNQQKGGSYTTTAIGEEVLAGSSIVARYRTGAAAPRSSTQTFTPPAVVLDLCPYTTDAVVSGSVLFRWMGQDYSDSEGVIYRGRTARDPGTPSGHLNYATGMAMMTDYVVGGTGPSDFQLLSLWTRKGQWTTASLFFSTEAAPLRAGAGGFVLTVVYGKGDTLTANVDVQGNITGLHMWGKIDFSRGGVELQFGDFVNDVDLTAAQKAEWWYSAADVGAVHPGKIWRPWPVDPTTLRYSCVSYIYLPVDVSLMGIDPAALPADGRVAFARPGDTCVVGVSYSGAPFAPSNGMTYSVGHTRLSLIQVLGPDGAQISTGYTTDLDAGTVTFTNVTGYPATVSVMGRTEVYRQIAEVRIDGRVRLTQPVGYAFDAGAVFSTALRQGDRFARVTRVYDQSTWNGTTWGDGLAGDQAVGQYDTTNHPVQVSNTGAITERWALRFRASGTVFDLIGQHLGQIASGTVNEDFSPINTARGAPYFTLAAAGWGAGWVAGNTLFIDTTGAEFPIAIARCTQPSTPAGVSDSVQFIQRGDVDTPPSAP